MQARDLRTQIPMRKSRRLHVGLDHLLSPLRNLIGRCCNKLKNARRAATRYDKAAESFLGFIDITSIQLWVRFLPTCPWISRS
ncbi:Transposase DDE domain-containing protein [Primorskyibacter flagellatus]|uniref:Transposase DDE domain-containing protein n=1 Tax=Primorskyibacter flagellatus TaxID=1387277 RepID=A0A1W2CPJ8_9RHOB|nr:Transposase DDE domain-containing protein [Primorskyibacter flagellatus]